MKKEKFADCTIGILSLQGSVVEHEAMLKKIGARAVRVNRPEQLRAIDGLILPGGESTTLGKLLRLFAMDAPLKERIAAGLPVLGTCAGLILLAKEIEGEPPHLAAMDIRVRRNAYGRQIDSFMTEAVIEEFSPKPMELVFIRAPWIEDVYGRARVLGTLDGHIIAARQDNLLALSFHPELTNDTTVHEYFADMCKTFQKAGRES